MSLKTLFLKETHNFWCTLNI